MARTTVAIIVLEWPCGDHDRVKTREEKMRKNMNVLEIIVLVGFS